MTFNTLKQQYIQAIYREKAFLIKEEYIKLHHGGESHLYLNHNQFLSKFANLRLLTDLYQQLLPNSVGNYKLGAVDSIMSPILCGLMAMKLQKDIVVIKEKELAHGLENKIYGDAAGEIILIDDVTSTGAILVNAANALREKGAAVKYALVSACRDMSAVNNLAKAGIKAFYIATYEEIIKNLWNALSEKEKEIARKENEEKEYHWQLT